MTSGSPPLYGPDATHIRIRVERAIAANRIPGFHFPGHLLAFRWPAFARDRAVIELPDGPHVRNAAGEIDRTVLAVVADTAVSTATRHAVAEGARLATIHLHMQFTAAPVRGDIVAEATPRGAGAGTGVASWLGAATLKACGEPVCYVTGEFLHLEPPPGVKLAPLPWQRSESDATGPIDEDRLTESERAVLAAADLALERASPETPFIEQLWGGEREPAPKDEEGARRRLAIGPHVGNRVGHVQGGILLGIAMATACDAAPASMSLANVSAWYVRPGRGDSLVVRSRAVHVGRMTAMVQTQVTCTDGSVALEVVTQHVLRNERSA